jgi:biopolymer transport protein ExbB
MLNLLIKGGPVMIFIGLCAIAATIIIIERLLYFKSIKNDDKVLVPALKNLLIAKKFHEAEAFCDTFFSLGEASSGEASPFAKLAKIALESFRKGEQSLPEIVHFAASREIPRIERSISALGTIAGISTLLGLLGTVFGNIEAFGILAESNIMGNPSLLAVAIAEALITTAAGLVVSIPANIFYNYLVSQANHLITETETSLGELLLLMNEKAENYADSERTF